MVEATRPVDRNVCCARGNPLRSACEALDDINSGLKIIKNRRRTYRPPGRDRTILEKAFESRIILYRED
jgi:hypothetical protein